MFKIYSKIALVAFIATLCSSNLLNAWGHFGAVLHKDGHVVRLWGDCHMQYESEISIEKTFIKNVWDSLENHLSDEKSGVFIVELGGIKKDLSGFDGSFFARDVGVMRTLIALGVKLLIVSVVFQKNHVFR